jgi:hypothetical protein
MTVPCDGGNHRPKIMETVAFISTENGDDLIVSFAVIDPADPTEIESLTLLRTPMLKPFKTANSVHRLR